MLFSVFICGVIFMEDHTYFISEVSRMVGVEPHVLRYWEEELNLNIARNSQGKRCYVQTDVDLFREVKYWKDKGMQLKAVKEVLDHGNVLFGGETETISGEEIPGEAYSIVTVEPHSDSRQKFEQILDEIVGQALERNNEKLLHQICDALSQELEDRLEMKLEELLQRELLQEMLQEGEREAAAARNEAKAGWWTRLRKRKKLLP